MSTDYAELFKTARGRVLKALWDLEWHPYRDLRVGGVRYSARLLELRRLGYTIQSRDRKDPKGGKDYRLESRTPGTPQEKKVKVFLAARDAERATNGHLTKKAIRAIRDAFGSYTTNRHKL